MLRIKVVHLNLSLQIIDLAHSGIFDSLSRFILLIDEVLDNLLFCNLFLFYLIFHTNHHNTMSCGFDEVAAAVEARSPVIVDVRTEDEFASGRIPGATNIPLSEVLLKKCYIFQAFRILKVEFAFTLPDEKFREKYGISKPDKESTFITSCKMGGRATKMRDKLAEMGFSSVKAYTGSMTEWINKGGEIEK